MKKFIVRDGCMLLCAPPPPVLLVVEVSPVPWAASPFQRMSLEKVLCVCDPTVWVCAGISVDVRTCAASPTVVPSVPKFASLVLNPANTLPRPSGILKVVVPLPLPNVVPIAAKSAAYVVRDTALPSQRSHPVGAVLYPAVLMSPGRSLLPSFRLFHWLLK